MLKFTFKTLLLLIYCKLYNLENLEELPYFKTSTTLRVHKNGPKSPSGTLTLLELDLELYS